jgi:MurNAc alpha-1-phosphate uridylyltransferase
MRLNPRPYTRWHASAFAASLPLLRMIECAIILAAGRGERMRPLTDHTPKPLLVVRGKRLIEWHLEALARAGVREVVINTAWLEDCFEPALGDGSRWGVRLHYSREGRDHGGALETAGGIAKALPLLGEVFWVVSGDVFLPGFPFDATPAQAVVDACHLAHLWLVPNAPHHPRGDFQLDDAGQVRDEDEDQIGPLPGAGSHAEKPGRQRLTWASVGLFRRDLFEDVVPGTRLPLRPLLNAAIAQGRLGGTRWSGFWTDVGTPERLQSLSEGWHA